MLFVAVSAVLAAPAAAAPTFEDIQVGSVVLRVPFPQGYCKPTGEQAGAFQEFAANDHDNVTLLTLVQCDPEAPSQGY